MNSRTNLSKRIYQFLVGILTGCLYAFPMCAAGQSNTALTALDLHAYCGLVGVAQDRLSDADIGHKNICLFYVSGVLDGFRIGDSSTKICTPNGATLGELALVVSKYLNQNPEKLHSPPEYLIIDALSTAFPCAASAPK